MNANQQQIKLSVIIPAYNEAETIASVINSVHDACRQVDLEDYEFIVSDDNSTDSTATLAENAGAKVVTSGKRNIAANRNNGAQAATGTHFLFLDADTWVTLDLLQATIYAFQKGYTGGGATISLSGPAPLWFRLAVKKWNLISRVFNYPAGSYLFVTREIFEKVKGFDEEYYASEELQFAKKIKPLGKIIILKENYQTSPRKVFQFSGKEFLYFFYTFLKNPKKTVTNREYLDIWYKRR